MTTQPTKKRKSVKLSKDEHRALLRFVKSFSTVVEASEQIGISRHVLDLVMIKGSGSPETIAAILNTVQNQAA